MSGVGQSASLRLRATAVCVDAVPLAIGGLILAVRYRKGRPPPQSAYVSVLTEVGRWAASSVALT